MTDGAVAGVVAGGRDETRGVGSGLVNGYRCWVRTALRIDQWRNQAVITQWPVEAPMLMTPDHAIVMPRMIAPLLLQEFASG